MLRTSIRELPFTKYDDDNIIAAESYGIDPTTYQANYDVFADYVVNSGKDFWSNRVICSNFPSSTLFSDPHIYMGGGEWCGPYFSRVSRGGWNGVWHSPTNIERVEHKWNNYFDPYNKYNLFGHTVGVYPPTLELCRYNSDVAMPAGIISGPDTFCNNALSLQLVGGDTVSYYLVTVKTTIRAYEFLRKIPAVYTVRAQLQYIIWDHMITSTTTPGYITKTVAITDLFADVLTWEEVVLQGTTMIQIPPGEPGYLITPFLSCFGYVAGLQPTIHDVEMCILWDEGKTFLTADRLI